MKLISYGHDDEMSHHIRYEDTDGNTYLFHYGFSTGGHYQCGPHYFWRLWQVPSDLNVDEDDYYQIWIDGMTGGRDALLTQMEKMGLHLFPEAFVTLIVTSKYFQRAVENFRRPHPSPSEGV